MGKIESFEDLEAWKRARIFANLIYKVSDAGEFGRDLLLETKSGVPSFL